MSRFSLIVVLSILSGESGAFEPIEALWGIDVGEMNASCELKTPINLNNEEANYGKMWVGFYILADDSDVPGYTLPRNEILFIVRSGPDLETSESNSEPVAISTGEAVLRSYRFDVDPRIFYFFAAGRESSSAYQSAIETGSLQILVKYKTGGTRKILLDTKEESGFRVFAEMLQACGRAIAG